MRHLSKLKEIAQALPEVNDNRYTTIKNNNYICITNKNAISTWTLSVITSLDSESYLCVGFDYK